MEKYNLVLQELKRNVINSAYLRLMMDMPNQYTFEPTLYLDGGKRKSERHYMDFTMNGYQNVLKYMNETEQKEHIDMLWRNLVQQY